MSNFLDIFGRFGTVVYVMTILFGLVIAIAVAQQRIPQVITYYHPIVHCNNGMSFDPNIKAIRIENQGDNGKDTFNTDQISSTCQYGNSYAYLFPSVTPPPNETSQRVIPPIFPVYEHQPHNFKLLYKTTYQTIGSWRKAIGSFVFVFLVVFLIAEVTRRTLRYIFFGKNFLILKEQG